MDITQARELLLEHSRHPRNQLRPGEPLTVGGVRGECRNPLCGDFVRVHLRSDKERVVEVALEVQGCTICTASASLMSENIRGLSHMQIHDLRQFFADSLIANEGEPWPQALESFRAFAHLRVNPARVPCALIPWYALKEALGDERV